jgi:hypothetical protein
MYPFVMDAVPEPGSLQRPKIGIEKFPIPLDSHKNCPYKMGNSGQVELNRTTGKLW